MKWLFGSLAVTGLACALGCSRGDISSEGLILHVVTYRAKENANSEKIQGAEDAIRAIPSKAPTMERFEWGRIDRTDERPRRTDHDDYYLLVLFKDPHSAFDRAYNLATREVVGLDDLGPYFSMGNADTYLLHDATPHARTSTHGHSRRAAMVRLTSNITPEETQAFEDAITALPDKIPTIERLEWGRSTGYNPSKPKSIDPSYRNGAYCLLFTFESTLAHDACLAHPAYKEFQSLVERYGSRLDGREFVAQVEYIARPD